MKRSYSPTRVEEIHDPTGTLELILKGPCPMGRPLKNCPLMEWRRRNHIADMTMSLQRTLLKKHLDCGKDNVK